MVSCTVEDFFVPGIKFSQTGYTGDSHMGQDKTVLLRKKIAGFYSTCSGARQILMQNFGKFDNAVTDSFCITSGFIFVFNTATEN